MLNKPKEAPEKTERAPLSVLVQNRARSNTETSLPPYNLALRKLFHPKKGDHTSSDFSQFEYYHEEVRFVDPQLDQDIKDVVSLLQEGSKDSLNAVYTKINGLSNMGLDVTHFEKQYDEKMDEHYPSIDTRYMRSYNYARGARRSLRNGGRKR